MKAPIHDLLKITRVLPVMPVQHYMGGRFSKLVPNLMFWQLSALAFKPERAYCQSFIFI